MRKQEHNNAIQVTKWLDKNDEGFCLSIGTLIKKNHGDICWIETDKRGKIALLRETKGLPFIKYLI